MKDEVHRGIAIPDLSDEVTSVKSHDEILQLIREIEELEKRIQQDDFVEFQLVPETTKIHDLGEISPDASSDSLFYKSSKHHQATGQKKGLLHRWRSLDKEVSAKDRLEAFLHPNPIRNVFVLRLTESGKLVGFNLKKPTPPHDKFSLKIVFKRKSKTVGSAEAEPSLKGIKGKLMGITSRFRWKGAGEGSSSAAGALGKIKGIFSKK